MLLTSLETGQSGIITEVGGNGALRHHFLDMGLIPGTEITLIKYAPMGDPVEFRIHSYELTLRLEDAARIKIKAIDNSVVDYNALTKDVKKRTSRKSIEHPGYGEGGRYHEKCGENPLPDDVKLTFALAGNQNCGKTTLFNQLTGSNQHVGNFPGVTVDRKSGPIIDCPDTEVTDLPGIYSLSPYTSEEIVTRQFIIN